MNKFSVYLILALLLSIGVFFNGCKKETDETLTNQNAKALFELTSLTSDTKARFLEIAPQVNGDPKLSLMLTMDWVLQQEGVVNAYQFDSTYLYIETSTGLKSMVWLNELDQDGESKYRGSGSGTLKAMTSKVGCSNVVENKNVLIYAPAYDEFLYPIASRLPKMLDTSSIIKDVKILKNEQATSNEITTFSNYGFVLIATHGTPSSFMTGSSYSFEQTEVPKDYEEFLDAVLKQVGQENLNRLISGKLMMSAKAEYDRFNPEWWEYGGWETRSTYVLWATSKFLEDIPSLSKTIVFGGFCFSGWITPVKDLLPDPIGQAFIDKKPITYYAYQRADGWSLKVDNLESIALEDSTIRSLIADNESTGDAHLQNDGTKFNTTFPDLFLVHMEQPYWCYEGCGEDLVDGRDDEIYKTVCIGDQVWMAENLRYDAPGSKVPEGKDISTYGRLYNYNAVTAGGSVWDEGMDPIQGICPENWHVPHRDDWKKLIEELGGEPGVDWFVPNEALSQSTIKLLGPDPSLYNYDFLSNRPEYNSTGFSSLSTGIGVIPEGQDYEYQSDEGRPYFWSSSPITQELDGDGNPTGIYDTESRWGLRIIPGLTYALYVAHPTVAEKYYPCRCVKD